MARMTANRLDEDCPMPELNVPTRPTLHDRMEMAERRMDGIYHEDILELRKHIDRLDGLIAHLNELVGQP
jgi:hypothetical protein